MTRDSKLKLKAESALENIRIIAERNMIKYQDYFPGAVATNAVFYPYIKEDFFKKGWHFGFWSGIYWLLYTKYGDVKFKYYAHRMNKICFDIVKNTSLRYSDVGMVYLPSCGAEYKLLGNKNAKNNIVYAASSLFLNYYPKLNVICAWEEEIEKGIASIKASDLVNLVILRYESKIIGNGEYNKVADVYLDSLLRYLFNYNENQIYDMIFFDLKTNRMIGSDYLYKSLGINEPVKKSVRSASWALLGLALNYKATKKKELIKPYKLAMDIIKGSIGYDKICEVEVDGISKLKPDTSTAAIAICGILEMYSLAPEMDCMKEYYELALGILESLIDNYALPHDRLCEGILNDGMYVTYKGVLSGSTVCGDYFFLEALIRYLDKDFEGFWY